MIEEAVFRLIGSYGFPIVITLLLLWDKLKSNKVLVQNNGLLRDAVQNNTHAIIEIKTFLERAQR